MWKNLQIDADIQIAEPFAEAGYVEFAFGVFSAPLSPFQSFQMDDLDELDDPDDEPWLENPVMGAEELLRFSRVRQLLQA